MEEILKQKSSVTLEECLRAFDTGAMFEFGVDKTELGFRLTINGQIIGIYLYPDADEFRKRIDSPYEAVITPDQARANSIEHEDGKNVVIYVSPADYEQFCQDAQTVYDLYHSEGLCFREIPDIWFSNLALVQFIRDHLRPHPGMFMWFGPGLHGTGGLWLGPQLKCPPWVKS